MTAKDFEKLANKLRPRLLSVAMRIVGNSAEADDVVQDCMLRLWSMRADLSGLRSPEAFASVMARRIAIDTLRRRLPRCEVEVSEAADISIPSAEEDLMNRERDSSFNAILDALPDSQYTLIRLRHIEGYDNAAIAALLGCTENAVRTALCRARKRVAELFAITQ